MEPGGSAKMKAGGAVLDAKVILRQQKEAAALQGRQSKSVSGNVVKKADDLFQQQRSQMKAPIQKSVSGNKVGKAEDLLRQQKEASGATPERGHVETKVNGWVLPQ